MGKIARLRRRFVARVNRRVVAETVAVFGGIVAVLSGVVSLLPQISVSWRLSALLLASAAVLAVMYAFGRTRPHQLPIDDLLPPEIPGSYSLVVTTEPSLVAQAHALASLSFDGAPAMPLDRYEQWLLINPTMLVCLLDQRRKVVGYFDVFPLREDFLNMLVAGVCSELEIRREFILPPQVASPCPERLYLGGVCVVDPDTHEGKLRARLLLWGLVSYLQHFYAAPCRTELIATAATPDGLRLLERLEFQLATPAGQRKDGVPLYKGCLTEERIERLLRWLPRNPSQLCHVSWVGSA
jgi:hypothetical protein